VLKGRKAAGNQNRVRSVKLSSKSNQRGEKGKEALSGETDGFYDSRWAMLG
jgi:hypothetical protein